jgi:hypothetical protein
MSRIWAACGERASFERIQGTLCRMVESQAQVATGAIVDSAAEQAVLEELLEASKPPPRPGSERLHYLLQTPFRYPPLQHGSRFGTRFEPSIFYGSLQRHAALAETAYYRFWFWFGMRAPPPAQRLITQHSLFRAGYDTRKGLRLQAPPFDAHATELKNPKDYAETQALGAALRAAGVEAFEYCSARDPRGGLNLAVFSPAAFSPADRIRGRQEWTCTTTTERVSFLRAASRETSEYRLEQFLVDGVFPDPAR